MNNPKPRPTANESIHPTRKDRTMKNKNDTLKDQLDDAAYTVKAGITKGRDVLDEKHRDAKRKVQEVSDGGRSAWHKIRAAVTHGIHIAKRTIRRFR